MHPHIETWGSILRLYSSKMAESYLKVKILTKFINSFFFSIGNYLNQNEKADTNENPNQKTSKDNSTTKSSTTTDTSAQKAKPNKELIEKLQEEMGKIRKPNEDIKEESKQADTLLTIPPLLVGNREFVMSSCNFLMSSDKNNKTEDLTDDNSGKILFENSKNDHIAIGSNIKDRAKKTQSRQRRRLRLR